MYSYTFTEKGGIINEYPVSRMRDPLKETWTKDFIHLKTKKVSITGKILASNRKEAEDILETIMEDFYRRISKL